MAGISFRLARVVALLLLLAGCGGGDDEKKDNSDNAKPEARAGSDQTVREGTSVTLDGSGSTDRDGTIASYGWTQVSGAPSVVLSGPNTVRTTFRAPDVGTDTI